MTSNAHGHEVRTRAGNEEYEWRARATKGKRWIDERTRAQADEGRYEDFAKRADPNNREHMDLLQEMKEHTEKLKKQREHEDPRLSFATPEFKEAQRLFQENFKVRAFDEARRASERERARTDRRRCSISFRRKTLGARWSTPW